MGLFKSIGKAFKKVFKGIKKVFKAVMKPIGKLLNSKFGKALMLGVAVFTLGTALLAGAQGFLAEGVANQGFLAKFVNGSKAFMNSLIGTQFDTVGGIDAGAGTALPGADKVAGLNTAQGAQDQAAQLLAPAVQGGSDAVGAVTAAGGTGVEAASVQGAGNLGAGKVAGLNATQSAAQIAKEAATKVTGGSEGGNLLSRAASAALDFAKTPGGSTIIGNVIAGAGAGAAARQRQKFDSRVERMFENPNDPGLLRLNAHDFAVNAPSNLSGRVAGNVGRSVGRDPSQFAPTIPFARPVPAPTGG